MADALAQGSAGAAVGEFEAAAQAAQREYPGQFADNANEFTGKLYRGEHDGTVRGWLIDRMGFRIEFGGFKDPRPRAGGGYIIIGRLAHIPEHLRQEAID